MANFGGFRGMQVHAVPESDRAVDALGRKLPWGYDADPSAAASLEKRELVEKGSFGRSQRRSRSGLTRSRSRTAEPRREEDRIKAEQLAAEDAVFGSLRRVAKEESAAGRREALGEVDANAVAQPSQTDGSQRKDAEPAEVVLYGFGEELQWAAIDFYERVSGGLVLEDYDRQPPGQRYEIARARPKREQSLSRAALRMKNRFAGGAHWIKVTFDSRSAAELACARSPHIIKGYQVFAEPYQGRGPGRDVAIPATQAGAQITDENVPATFSTNTNLANLDASPNGSSTTATSATATTRQEAPAPPPPQPAFLTSFPSQDQAVLSPRASIQQQQLQKQQALDLTTLSSQPDTLRRRTVKIEGATPAPLLPASEALLPKQAKPSWSTWLGTSEVIGSAVPKKEDGSFDDARASLYWLIFWWLDQLLGTDFCGLKGE